MQGVDRSQELRQLATGFVGEWAASGPLWREGEGFVGNMVGRNSQDGMHWQPLGRGSRPQPTPPGSILGHCWPPVYPPGFESLPVFFLSPGRLLIYTTPFSPSCPSVTQGQGQDPPEGYGKGREHWPGIRDPPPVCASCSLGPPSLTPSWPQLQGSQGLSLPQSLPNSASYSSLLPPSFRGRAASTPSPVSSGPQLCSHPPAFQQIPSRHKPYLSPSSSVF